MDHENSLVVEYVCNTCSFLIAFRADFLVLYATKPYPMESIAPGITPRFNSDYKGFYLVSSFVSKV